MFLDPNEFEFTSMLEAKWEVIRDEFVKLRTDSFDPWVQRQMYGEGWSVYGLFALGNRIDSACLTCPRTAEIIANIPDVSLAGFSRMAPHSHIKPHVGWAKSVYRLHLGLVVPSGCRLRVNDDTRHWHEGKVLIFDDTVEHEAWNDSDEVRGNLLLDFLRPGETSFEADIPSQRGLPIRESLSRQSH